MMHGARCWHGCLGSSTREIGSDELEPPWLQLTIVHAVEVMMTSGDHLSQLSDCSDLLKALASTSMAAIAGAAVSAISLSSPTRVLGRRGGLNSVLTWQ
jgi:hypothetical protein